MEKQYQETLDWLFAQLPMFHRVGAVAYKANLDNTYDLMEVCGNPHKDLKAIHIAGTNGKGSSSHMLASVFAENGYKVGLYTSPHLVDFRERIRINGEMISKESVLDFVSKVRTKVDDIRPSFFEWTVALAFHHFKKENVDIAIIETGLGGRLDSTNVITPELSLITNISMDHAALLGDTLEKIAAEKAGIVKSNIPVLISEHSGIDSVFIAKAFETNSPIMFATDTVLVEPQDEVGLFKVKVADDLFWDNQLLKLDLQGTYQGKNVAGVLCSILALKSGWSLEDVAIKRGIENASRNTGLQGRWMCLQENPYVFADIAHNEAGIQEVVRSLGNYQFDKLHIVFGAVQDKEVAKVLQLLPAYAKFHCCSPKLPRAMSLEMLMENMMNATKESIAYSSVKEAYEGALAVAAPRDFVLVCGSNFVVAEVLESLTGV